MPWGLIDRSVLPSLVFAEGTVLPSLIDQLPAETSLPPVAVNAVIAGIVGFNVLTALNPASPTFSDSNQKDVKKRPKGPIQNPKINPIENPTEFLGIDKVNLVLCWRMFGKRKDPNLVPNVVTGHANLIQLIHAMPWLHINGVLGNHAEAMPKSF